MYLDTSTIMETEQCLSLCEKMKELESDLDLLDYESGIFLDENFYELEGMNKTICLILF